MPTDNLRRLKILVICALLPAGAAEAQLVCQRTDQPSTVRAEGITELLGDIVLSCTGGTTTPAGRALPTYEFLITSAVPFTSRSISLTAQSTSLDESLLVVDEPPFPNQIGCTPQLDGTACPIVAGTPGSPNVFQGRQVQDVVIAFRQIPINPPGPTGTRILRFTNLRANIAALAKLTDPSSPQLTIQMFGDDGTIINIGNATMPLAVPQPGAVFSIRAAGDMPPAVPGPALTVPPASLPAGIPQAAQSLVLKFTEGYPSAFRRRNVGTSSADPLFATVQATPGVNYGTESGFFNDTLPATTGMNTAGLADSGTRLQVKIQSIPATVMVWVSTRDIQTGTTGFSPINAKALLTAADSFGAGPLTPQAAQSGMYVALPVTDGTATAVWEVVSSDPTVTEQISFSLAITGPVAASGAATTAVPPGQGTATISGGLAPLTGGTTNPIPEFQDVSIPAPGFAVSNVITLPQLVVQSAAGSSGASIAPGSIASGFGHNLASGTAVPGSLPLPDSLIDTVVDVIDATGGLRSSPLYLVSPSQVNFLLDPATSVGPALVRVTRSASQMVASGVVQVDPVAPALFSANATGAGVAAGQLLRSSNGVTTMEPIAALDGTTQQWTAVPIDLGGSDLVFLTLYGTGIRNRADLSDVRVTINALTVPVIYAGAQNEFPGLDQINVGPLPSALQGSGTVPVAVAVAGRSSNTVTIQVQ